MCFGICFCAFVRSLVKAAVHKLTDVGNYRNLIRFVFIAVFVARGEREATCNDSHNKKRYE